MKESIYYFILIALLLVGLIFAFLNTVIMAFAFTFAFLVLFFREQLFDLLKAMRL